MDAKQLSQWEIKDLTAEKAVDWLTKTNHVSGHAALFGLANFIQRQDQEITRFEGQHVFDNSQIVEYEGIVRVQAAKIERQEKMLAMACREYSCAADCWDCNANTCKIVGAAECEQNFAAWLEAEAGK